MSAKTIRLTVADANGRHDLVVAADSTVSELLAVGGVDLRRYVGTTTSGAAIDLDHSVSVTPGDGGVIWLFDRTQTDAGPSAGRSARSVAPVVSSYRDPLLLALLLLITAILVLCAVLAPTPLIVGLSAVLLLAGAAGMLARPVSESTLSVAYVAPLLGGAAGSVLLAGFHDAGGMIAAGLVAGATVACIRHAQAQVTATTERATTAVIAALWSVFAVLDTAAFLAEIPATTMTALHIACAVPIFHYMRAAALDIDASELIDTPFVIRDAQGLRTGTPVPPSPVHAEAAGRQYLIARRRSEAGILAACTLALLSTLFAVPTVPGHTVESWCVLGGSLGAGCYFLLTSRTVRNGLSRAAALVTGAVISAISAAALLLALQPSGLLVALVLLLAGVVVGCLTVPLARDWRSLGWSRTGDIVEGLLLALAPAALLYGSGIAGQILEVFS